MRVDNDVVPTVYRSVLAVVESVRFALFVQLPAVGITRALLNLASRWWVVFVVELLLAQFLSLFCYRRIQFTDVGFGCTRDGDLDLFVLVRQGFNVRAVGIQNLAADKPFRLRLI